MERCYRIFGKVIKLNTLKSSEGDLLHDELSLYPRVNSSEIDIVINYVSHIDKGQILSVNPSINHLKSNSMICKLGAATVKFYFEDQQVKQIDFSIDQALTFRGILQKWQSIQYTSSREAIGQIFHELILVPLAFTIQDYSVVHSSGIVNKEGNVVLFGGTGGVGKTSLEMVLCLEDEYSFYNDDIAVLDSNGNCFPNFSYPKIYGYNLQGAPSLKKKIISHLGVFNKIQYKYRALKGMNKVRRRVQPEALFGSVYNTSKLISSFVILFKSKVKKITLESISAQKASSLNSMIISSEYNVFFNHLRWHNYNATSLDRDTFITYKSVMEQNTVNLEKSLNGLEKVYLAHIPIDISNKDYKKQMVQTLKEHNII